MPASSHIGADALAPLIPALAQQPGPRYLALSSALTTLLFDGRLASGVRLPAERELAVALQLSRSTVTAAYDQLVTDGVLSRRRGAGSYLKLPANTSLSGPAGGLKRSRPGAAVLDLSSASLSEVRGLVSAAARRAVERLDEFTGTLGYHPYGLPELRAVVAERYQRRGLPTEPGQILITSGAQHGFDLVLAQGIDAGDRVLTELPTYAGALEVIKARQGRAVAVPFGADGGWDVTAISNTIRQTAPRLAFLIPDFHNPTGALIDAESRRAVVAAARRAGTTVVVDESFVDLDLRADPSSDPPVPTATFGANVISLGSLSKPLWAGLRIGWIRADPETIHRLALVRSRSDIAGPVLEQLLTLELFADFDDIIAARRIELRAKRATLLAALAEQLPAWQPSPTVGGMSTWVRLDAPRASALTARMEQQGVLLTPGARFAPDGALERYLRLPFSLPEADLVRAVSLLRTGWDELDLTQVGRSQPLALVTA